MTICGLDFGTSNSTIGVLKNNQNTMVPLEQDAHGQWQTTIPSALFFGFGDDHVSFGRQAIARYTDGESGRLMRSMKSVLGSSLMGDSTWVRNQLYSYDDIIGFFIASLKKQAESFLELERAESTPLESVVIGRPVHFNDDDPALDRAAEEHLATIARIAGFKQVSFQFEPIAAALDYEQQVISEELALIIDIGGGTSDFTLIRLAPERHQQIDRQEDFLGNHGIHLGGTDFDRLLSVAAVMPEFGLGMPMADRPSLTMPSHYYFDLATWHKIHLLYERRILQELKQLRLTVSDKKRLDRLLGLLQCRQGHQLAALVEQAKIELSSKQEAVVNLATLFPDDADITADNCILTQEQLRQSLQRDINKIFAAMDETLQQAGVSHQQINTVFTTGGSTALPMVGACINNAFPHARQVAGDLYNSVGSGLLMEARKRYR